MFSTCANPQCGAEFDFRRGKFFRFPHNLGQANTTPKNHGVRHFWLCGRCSDFYKLEYRDPFVALVCKTGFATEARALDMSPQAAESFVVRRSKRIFQVTYNEPLRLERGEVLKEHGYGVESAAGNEAAKILLGSSRHYDLFIIGRDAPEQTRKEMADWLKAKYPHVKIVALRSVSQEIAVGDYNIVEDSAENWLSVVAEIMDGSPSQFQLFAQELRAGSTRSGGELESLFCLASTWQISRRLLGLDLDSLEPKRVSLTVPAKKLNAA